MELVEVMAVGLTTCGEVEGTEKDVFVGDTATTTPGPVHPFLPVKLLLRHTMVVSPALVFSLG